ncbi:AraC family transcriptional regulator [Roseovarius sp.]|uniref:AraC family transcriptional regulator n=2 Tax=Roseovarius sp. TaxID=1486281 RepID=UPI0025DB536A|nr:AraC family transcriptional regulator [Roseovarius sp.]
MQVRIFVSIVRIVMDTLSEIVALLQPHDCVAAGFDAAGDWSIQFERHVGLKCNSVIKGGCWITVDDGKPVWLDAGDCAILPHGLPFILSARSVSHGTDAHEIYAPVAHGGTASYGGGGEFFMAGSRFLLSGPAAEMLLPSLPPILVVRGGEKGEVLAWAVNRIAGELRAPEPGSALTIAHLAHLILVQALRAFLAQEPSGVTGWLAALSDLKISRAVAAIHAEPAQSWTVAGLASEAGLSRTTFAERFRQITGQTPLGYVTQWRMLLAMDRLLAPDAVLVRIASDVGYSSESAFAAAFKRETGHSPRRYARGARSRTSGSTMRLCRASND